MDDSSSKKPDRFGHIEIGSQNLPKDSSEPNAASSTEGKCIHCGSMNEPDRTRCRGCFRKRERFIPAGAHDQTLEVDGVLYRRDDPQLPEDIRVLMDRVREEGMSDPLMRDWRNWRMTRKSQPGRESAAGSLPKTAPAPLPLPPTRSRWEGWWRDDMPPWGSDGGFGYGNRWGRRNPADLVLSIISIVLAIIAAIFRGRFRWF